MSIIENRAVGMLIIEAINSNPNGDPDRESDPRQRLEDNKGEISPVSFKRKLRDLVENKLGPVWLKLAQDMSLAPEEFDILESRGRKREEISGLSESAFIKRYWDGRVFGNTFLEEKKGNLPIKTGAVQFALGISIAPINIERMTNTNKAGVQSDKDRGMAPLAYRVVQHAVYCMPFFVNPTSAQRSGCTAQDIELMLRLIPYAYAHSSSYVRPQMEIRHAWFAEHKSALGSFSDQAFIEALTPRKKEEQGKASFSWADYQTPTNLPEPLAGKIKGSLRDLVGEVF